MFRCYPPLPTRPQTNCSLKERIQIRDHYSAVNTGNLAVTFHVWQEATLCILRTGNSLQPYSCLSKASQQPHFPLQPPLFGRRGQRKGKGSYLRRRRGTHFQPISTYHYPSGEKTSHTTHADTQSDVGTFSCLIDTRN